MYLQFTVHWNPWLQCEELAGEVWPRASVWLEMTRRSDGSPELEHQPLWPDSKMQDSHCTKCDIVDYIDVGFHIQYIYQCK